MTRNVVIIEDRLEVALPMAALLEARGFSIVGLIVERAAALAVAEGEGADFSARVANLPLNDQRSRTCVALLSELGIPTLQMRGPVPQTYHVTRASGVVSSLSRQRHFPHR